MDMQSNRVTQREVSFLLLSFEGMSMHNFCNIVLPHCDHQHISNREILKTSQFSTRRYVQHLTLDKLEPLLHKSLVKATISFQCPGGSAL